MENAEGDLATDRERRNVGEEKRGIAQVEREKEKDARNDNFAEEPSCARARAREREPRINLNIDMTLPSSAMLGGASLNAR